MTAKTVTKTNRKNQLDARVGLYRRLAWGFIIFTSALVILIIILSLNRATITIVREPQSVVTDFSIPIYSDNPPQTNGTFLVGKFYTQELQAETVLQPETGTKVDDYAYGPITIINETGRAQPLVATTRFLTADEKLFRLVRSVIVPAQGKISAEIKADQKGAGYEINTDTHLTIPGLHPDLQPKIYALSDAPFTGGTRELATIVESDIERARQTLEDKLANEARAAFASELDTAQTPTSGQAMSLQIISFTHNFNPRRSADTLEASAKTRAVLFAFDEAALIEQARSHLADTLPSNYILNTTNLESFSYILETPPGKTADRLKVHLEGAAVINPSDSAFSPDIWTNMNVIDIKKQLEQLPGVNSATIETSAFWSDRTPRDSRSIVLQFLP